jgi:hypothetical protein
LTLLAGIGVGICAAAYALITGRDSAEVAMSGQHLLGVMAQDPTAFPSGALIALLLFKGLGYSLSMAALRGGPIFPAVALGGTLGLLVADLPGLGFLPAFAAGVTAATVSVLPMPVSSAALVVLLLGTSGYGMVPVVLIATVIALVVGQIMERGLASAAAEPSPSPSPSA